MEGVTAGGVLGDQVRAGKFGQQVARLRQLHVGQAGGRRGRDVRAGMDAQQSEQPRRRRAELLIRPGEYRTDAGGRVTGIQRVQRPASGTQFRGQVLERVLGAGGGPRGSNGQRQRQPCAQPDELGHGFRVRLHSPGAKPPGQQLAGLLLGEQAEGQQPGSLDGGQPRELAAAGDHHQAASRARQQRPHLRRVACVVEHNQYPLARQHAAVQRRLSIGISRDGLRRHPQGGQEPPHDPRRGNRVAGRAEPAKVSVQLPVRK